MTKQGKRRGTEAEVWPVQYAWKLGLEAERLRLAGELDWGDMWVRTPIGLAVIQCKAVRGLSLPATLKEAQEQAERYAEARGLPTVPRAYVLVRPYGMGRENVHRWPLVSTLEQALTRG